MISRFGRIVLSLSLFAALGCGGDKTEPAKATPEMAPEAKDSMKKYMEGGGGAGPKIPTPPGGGASN
jgi:hypothetical protein